MTGCIPNCGDCGRRLTVNEAYYIGTRCEACSSAPAAVEQAAYDDWCRREGNPDPRTVWAAAWKAATQRLATEPAHG